MTPITRMTLFFAIMFAFPVSLLAGGLTGTVVSVNGLDVTIKIDSFGSFSPAVGDKVDVIKVADGGRVEFDIGDWEVTEVDGKMVKASAVNALGINPPKVNMKAVIHLSPGPVHAGEPPAAAPEKKGQSVAEGKVIMMRGKDVTIKLEDGQAQAAVGDEVELSFTTAGIEIPVGTWRVSALKEDSVVEATPSAPKGEPTIGMDARVFTNASSKQARVDSKKEPVRPDASNITAEDKSPLETACLNGDANACNDLGVKYATGKGATLNYSRAVEFYRKACDGGSASGCTDLGYMYENGHGVSKDEKMAVDCYRKGCDRGNAIGCANLGYMYKNGHGVKKDHKLAADFYQKGCDGGYASGCTDLGYMYEKGYGVSKDEKMAADFYRKGCDGGGAIGCTNLGYMYEIGSGVKKDHKLAAGYYQKGCEGGSGRGCGNLGWMVYHGRGTTADRAHGKKLMEQACGMGFAWSCDRLKEIGK